jgi:hypothetical protein
MPDQVVKTTLVVNANASGMKSIGEALDELISKAKELNDLLGGIKVGGGEGAGAGGKGGKGGASGGSSWDQPQPGGEGEGGADSGGGGKGRKRRRKGGASGGSTGEGDGGGDSGGDDDGLTDGEKQAKRTRQRLGYAVAVGTGMLARSVKSHYIAYHEGMYGAQATEAAGEFSGDIYQHATAFRQASAQREQAQLRHSSGWAKANVAASGGQMLGAGLMMVPSLPTVLAGLGILAGSTILGGVAGKKIAQSGAEIDTETAKQVAAINALQRRQELTMSLVGMQFKNLAFGVRFSEDYKDILSAGTARGFAPLETQALTNRYMAAGGSLKRGGATIDDFLFYHQNYNIAPETMGRIETAFAPGGGAILGGGAALPTQRGPSGAGGAAGIPAAAAAILNPPGPTDTLSGIINQIVNAGTNAGVPVARADEWLQRGGRYLMQGAERNINIPGSSLVDTMNYLPTSVKGFARMAGAENMRATGVSMADELGNMMMPQDLARGLLMANIVGKGGGPADWQKQMTDPSAFAGNMADIYAQMPDMLKQFFVQSTTGLMGVSDFGPDAGGQTDVDRSADVGASNIRDTMQKAAKNQELYIATIKETTDQLDKLNVQIRTAIDNMKAYGDKLFVQP